MLNTVVTGTATDKPALLIAHGLFGSARNWGVIAKRLADTRRVIAVDMRNHGDSFHSDTHRYPEMAEDLAEVIAAQDGPADVMGHSMGGKAAMMLALTQPALVRRLIVADIAPVAYAHDQFGPLDAMRGVDLSNVTTRKDAADQMDIDPAVIPFLLQSLNLRDKRWDLNLDTLAADMGHITGWPEVDAQFDGPVLMLRGANSDYVTADHATIIAALFPRAHTQTIADAGHWLHAEQPRAVETAVRDFLDQP
ncbi:Pimeloyl-ACP methyl ester carboxylesterase [Loktanella sp. DSM 29012]|uniref:alpha/beta fold hydrolase n=1 Tax=Loktanella sp. DSM 29012 TaxID=1881056 RepID=UPI0008AFE654|nr:alpha/beta fold hydrolase [Loktanella sp. DSM 29012]SEQ62046.1 Pimeloyl-ACP methyl ester carboxylesterase [Loktanella sp. DSM 29012]